MYNSNSFGAESRPRSQQDLKGQRGSIEPVNTGMAAKIAYNNLGQDDAITDNFTTNLSQKSVQSNGSSGTLDAGKIRASPSQRQDSAKRTGKSEASQRESVQKIQSKS